MSTILDPAKLKVVELRAELSARGLDTKGNKPVLVKRLRDALENESGTGMSLFPSKTTPEYFKFSNKNHVHQFWRQTIMYTANVCVYDAGRVMFLVLLVHLDYFCHIISLLELFAR